MRRVFTGGLLCFLLLLSPASAEALRVSGNRLFLPVQINGQGVEALLDSGAEMTLIDTTVARRLGLELAGSAQARGSGKGTETVQFAPGVEIQAAGVTLRDRTVAVLDLSEVATRLVGEPLSVVLGRELFDAGRFRLNIEQGRFEPVSRQIPPEGTRLPLADSRGIKQLPIRIDGGNRIWADFDLGNGSEMLVGRKYAASSGLLSVDRIISTKTGGGIGGAHQRIIVRLMSVEIAEVAFRRVDAAIDPLPDAPDANVGVSLLRRFEMTIDFGEDAVWLKPIE